MAFRAIAMRVVEEFFIVFGNHRPMYYAIDACACWAIEGRPEMFEIVEPCGVGGRKAGSKNKLGSFREHHPLLADETTDADCATVFGQAVEMASRQDLHHAGIVAAQRAGKRSLVGR